MSNIKIWSEEEIDIILEGDRRVVDKLLLHGLNNVCAVLIPHMEKEEATLSLFGSTDDIRARTKWLDSQIEKQKKRNEMMDKVISSSLAWAAIAFLGFLFYAVADSIMEHARTWFNSHSSAASSSPPAKGK